MNGRIPSLAEQRPSSRPTELYAISALTAFFLILPFLLSATNCLSRRQVYQSVPASHGPFGFFEKEIFDEKKDIDMLFVGPSYMWNAVDGEGLESLLKRKKDVGSTVRVLSGNWFGADLYYVVLRDLLARRNVKNVFLPLSMDAQTAPHVLSYYWYTLDWWEMLGFHELSLQNKLTLFSEHILGAPRHLLSSFRSNLSFVGQWQIDSTGAYPCRLGYEKKTFEEFNPPPPVFSEPGPFRFQTEGIPNYLAAHLNQTVRLLKAHGVRIHFLYIPPYVHRYNDKAEGLLTAAVSSDREIKVIGVSPKRLFSGLGENEIAKLFYDGSHMNRNGMRFFTRSVLYPLVDRGEVR